NLWRAVGQTRSLTRLGSPWRAEPREGPGKEVPLGLADTSPLTNLFCDCNPENHERNLALLEIWLLEFASREIGFSAKCDVGLYWPEVLVAQPALESPCQSANPPPSPKPCWIRRSIFRSATSANRELFRRRRCWNKSKRSASVWNNTRASSMPG